MRDFSHSLPMALLKVREAVMVRFRAMLRQYDLTEQQWRVLRALMETPGFEVSELAETCFILMPSLSRILRNLESRKLIRRRPVQGDHRRAVIAIAPEGRRLVHKVGPSSEERYREITRAVGAKKMDELYKLLEYVTKALNGNRL